MTAIPLGAIDSVAIAFLQRCGGDDLVRNVVGLFTADAPARIGRAQKAAVIGDLVGVGSALHSLKSSAGQLGARRLAELCERGEMIAKSGADDRLADIVAEAARELDVALRELRQVSG